MALSSIRSPNTWEGTWNTKRELSYYPGGKYVKTAELRVKSQNYRWGTYTRREYRPGRQPGPHRRIRKQQGKEHRQMPDGPNNEREAITGDAAKLTTLLPLLSKTIRPHPSWKCMP